MTKTITVALAATIALAGMQAPAHAGSNCSFAHAGRCKVDGNKVPTSDVEFKQLRAKLPKDPFHAAALYVYALIRYASNPKVGEQLMLLASHKSVLARGNVYKGYGWGSRMAYFMRMAKKYNYCFPGFASNAQDKNGKFVVDENNAEVEIRIQTKYVPNPASGRAKLWVCPINKYCFPLALRTKLIRLGGKTVKTWAVNGASSAFTGCRLPKRKMTVDPSL